MSGPRSVIGSSEVISEDEQWVPVHNERPVVVNKVVSVDVQGMAEGVSWESSGAGGYG